jgi:hypothetical protein
MKTNWAYLQRPEGVPGGAKGLGRILFSILSFLSFGYVIINGIINKNQRAIHACCPLSSLARIMFFIDHDPPPPHTLCEKMGAMIFFPVDIKRILGEYVWQMLSGRIRGEGGDCRE